MSLPKASLPAQVSFCGYSVCGADQELRNGALVFQINAHGIENGREPAYYKALSDGALKGPKSIEYIQGATHGYNPPKPLKQVISNK